MTNHEYATMMYADGMRDGADHATPKYADVPEYAIGYATGEAR